MEKCQSSRYHVFSIFRSDRISSFYIVSKLVSGLLILRNWQIKYLYTWILEYLYTCILEYLNTWVPEYLTTWLLEYLNTFVFCYFHVGYSILLEFLLEVVWNPQDLLLMMGTEILKIDAEMAEKIEVEVGTFTTEINFLTVCHFPNGGCQLQLQFSQPFLHRFWKSLCPSTRGDPDDSKTPPEVIFLMIIVWEKSWGFQNTPNNQLLGEFWPRKQPKTKLHKNCFSKLSIKIIFGNFYFL